MSTKPKSRLVGYARVSTSGQELQLQLDALKNAGVTKADVYTDKASGSKADALAWRSAFSRSSPATSCSSGARRLGRSLRHLIDLVEDLRNRGVGFKSICDGAIDTTTASGELIFNVFASLAQFERRLIQERTKAGLASARAADEQVDGLRSQSTIRESRPPKPSTPTRTCLSLPSARR